MISIAWSCAIFVTTLEALYTQSLFILQLVFFLKKNISLPRKLFNHSHFLRTPRSSFSLFFFLVTLLSPRFFLQATFYQLFTFVNPNTYTQ